MTLHKKLLTSSTSRRLSQIAVYKQYPVQIRTQDKNLPLYSRCAIASSAVELEQHELIKRNTFMLICMLKLSVCIPWALMCYAFDLKLAAVVPLSYAIALCTNFAFVISEKNYEIFVINQLVLILICPLLCHVILGGVHESGGVMLWSFLCPLGGAFFRSAAESVLWFRLFLLLIVPLLVREIVGYEADPVPHYVSSLFWAVNCLGVLTITFGSAHYFAKALETEYDRSECLLHNILPKSIAKRIKKGENPILDKHEQVSLLFTDVVGFTTAAATMRPEIIIESFLEEFFYATDVAVEKRKLTKIKTIGDAYMVAGGLEKQSDKDYNHVQELLGLAADLFQILDNVNKRCDTDFQIRVGMHVGPVIAGVLGTNRFAFDVWGDSVNTASRMESHGKAGLIHLSDSAYQHVQHAPGFSFECDGESTIKGKGKMVTYYAKPT